MTTHVIFFDGTRNGLLDKATALRKAEKLADQFQDIKPVPYRFFIDRNLGLPEMRRTHIEGAET